MPRQCILTAAERSALLAFSTMEIEGLVDESCIGLQENRPHQCAN
jgi:hypothetical protein